MSQPTLRVAIFAESYLPFLSGVTVSTETLARGLRAQGHDVLLVAPRPTDGQPGSAGAAGPEPGYAWLPSYQAPSPVPSGYRMPVPLPSAALRAAAGFRPDVVHAQSPFVAGLMARRLAQRSGAPLVFTHHTRFSDYRHYLGPLAAVGNAAMGGYLRDFWRGCAAIVAPGSRMAREISERLGTGPRPLVRAIPSGVDVGAIGRLQPLDPRPQHGWPSDAVVVVSIGRLAAEKSVELLVDAFSVAATTDQRLRLLLIGGGPAEGALRGRSAEPDLAGRLALTGRLPRTTALALARSADLFAFASRTETQGLVLAEALAAGLPIVAVDGPGVEDAVRHGVDGVLVAAGGRHAVAARMGLELAALAADRQARARLAVEARAGAERFDVSRRVAEVAELYRDVLEAGPVRR